ncbi:MAG: hypothetical protein DLM59_11500 [Pseudonocardiales bacterium]|nr:MAG: hypothetical protein DLM59_11500 [Pseudonocardiales bacterium]
MAAVTSLAHQTATAEHRPITRRRRFAHDDLVAVDLFSGFGGLTQGIERAGFTTIMAANHNRYKVEVHEANHPNAEHWIADLVDPESSDYHSARDLPAADLLVAGAARGACEPLPTQGGSETLGLLSARVLPNRTNGTSRSLAEPMETLVGNAGSGGLAVLSSGVLPYRQNTVPTVHAEAMPTVTADQIPGMLTAAGTIKNNGAIDEAKYRAHPVSNPLGTIVGSAITQGMLFSGWYKQNGRRGDETAPHPMTDPFGTLTSRDTTALLMAEWRAALADLRLEDCYFRMMSAHEVGRGCGFDVDFPGYDGAFVVWGSARDQVDGFGNAVSPQVGEWMGSRLRAVLHSEVAA